MDKTEAIKILKDFHDESAIFSVRTALETLHPELKESEDERIRKELIEHVKDQQSSFISAPDCRDKYEEEENNKYNSWIAWLEKQGVQEFAEKVESKFKVKYAGNEYNVLDVKENMGITWYGIEDEPNHIDYVKANSCEIISGYAIKENGSPYPTKIAVFSEQKPTDEDMKEALRTEYEKGRADAFAEMQKEWSEEDEVKINRIVACLENLNVADNDILLKDVDWLKSLKDRYTWKPSDEQIVVLELASKYERVFTLKQIDILIGLKEQLKKLKG